jgi:DNA transformation protein and related proteins
MPSVTRQYQDFILDLLTPLAPQPRRMFSGVGLFHRRVMFGLLVREAFYLRVDERSRLKFEDAGSVPFSYVRAGRTVSLAAYYEVPEGLLDQPEQLLIWAREAVAVAQAVKQR